MLFPRRFLDGVAAGEISLAFRRWARPQARVGGRHRTAIGVLAIDAVEPVAAAELTDSDARGAGYASRADLLTALDGYGDEQIYRITLHLHGPDPRIALRERSELNADELAALRRRLDRLDRASSHGPWTLQALELISAHPGSRAPDLAAMVGRETQPFKVDVRKLKELGLTESLAIGYRLSPRGQVLLDHLRTPPQR